MAKHRDDHAPPMESVALMDTDADEWEECGLDGAPPADLHHPPGMENAAERLLCGLLQRLRRVPPMDAAINSLARSSLARYLASRHSKTWEYLTVMLVSLAVLVLGYHVLKAASSLNTLTTPDSFSKWTDAINHSSACDSVFRGFNCSPQISHYWGQYSPYFSVPSEISADIPSHCSVTFAQVLSRHGARDPTASKTKTYNNTILKIQQNTDYYEGNVTFLRNLVYSLGADQLTTFGQKEMYNSGIKFYQRYASLARTKHMFVRSSGETRVVESAENFTQGFHTAMVVDKRSNLTGDFPYDIVAISEAAGSNNTLSHDLCTAFENESSDVITARGQGPWSDIFFPPIAARINHELPGANLTLAEVSYLMDLCPFYTVADTEGKLSEFCYLFSEREWKQYDYYQSLGKYYNYGAGDPLGPTQGVGWTNELIARLTNTPVHDHTSTNSTLDSNPATFPLGPSNVLFADFSHDNDMTAIFYALGLYNKTAPLSNSSLESAVETNGYTTSWTVPFAARLYVEKLACGADGAEYVRFVVNDRVVPLPCADLEGKCELGAYLDTLAFAKAGGNWTACFE